MRIPISVLNYNGSKDTIELIKTLVKSGECFDCIIVDNNSPKVDDLDKIAAFIENEYKTEMLPEGFVSDAISSCVACPVGDNRFTLIRAKENYGFAKGTNIGIKYGFYKYPDTEYMVILNNDTIVNEGFISKVIAQIKKHDLAAGMGTILYYGYDKPYIWSIGGTISFVSAMGVHLHKGEVYSECNEEVVKRQFISGCFTVFKADVLKEIGLIDEDYFFGGEEYQYSVDISKKYSLGWIPSSLIYHKSKIEEGNGSSHRIEDLCWQYNSYMNKIIFTNKNKGCIYRFFWHIMFYGYINTRIRKKYLRTKEYGRQGFKKLETWLFRNINSKRFARADIEAFSQDKTIYYKD